MSANASDVDDAAHLVEQVALECGAEVGHIPLFGKRISFASDQLLDFAARCQVRLGAEREIQAITAERDALMAVVKSLSWRMTDIRDMLMARNGLDESIYGCDEWSAPTVNLATAITVAHKALAKGIGSAS